MGIFDFFLPKKKKEKEIVTIALTELEQWFTHETAGKRTRFEDDTQAVFLEIKNNIEGLLNAIVGLEKALLKDTNLAKRIMDLVEGNRGVYIQKSRLFLDWLGKAIPEKSEYAYLKEFCQNYQLRMTAFSKETVRSYSILTEFYGDNMKEIAKVLKNVDLQISALSNIIANEQGMMGIDKAHREIKELLYQFRRQNERKDELANLRSEIEEIKLDKHSLQESIITLEASPETVKLHGFLEAKRNAEITVKEVSDELTSIFSPIKRAIRKIIRIYPDYYNTANPYLSSEEQALIHDPNLLIIPVLEAIKKEAFNGAIESDEREQHKIFDAVGKITKPILEDIRKKLCEANKDISSSAMAIGRNEALKKKQELDYRKEYLDARFARVSGSIEQTEKAISSNSIGNAIKEIEKKLDIITGFQVNIAV